MEQWTRWIPIEGLAPKYYIEEIHDLYEGFTVILSDDKETSQRVRLYFEGGIDSYTRTDETFRLHMVHDLKQKYGSKFYGSWTFFKVTNSLYLQWLAQQSYDISKERFFMHFSIVAADSVLDIITNYEPTVSFITRNKDDER